MAHADQLVEPGDEQLVSLWRCGLGSHRSNFVGICRKSRSTVIYPANRAPGKPRHFKQDQQIAVCSARTRYISPRDNLVKCTDYIRSVLSLTCEALAGLSALHPESRKQILHASLLREAKNPSISGCRKRPKMRAINGAVSTQIRQTFSPKNLIGLNLSCPYGAWTLSRMSRHLPSQAH
jgi:hypothetical protein